MSAINLGHKVGRMSEPTACESRYPARMNGLVSFNYIQLHTPKCNPQVTKLSRLEIVPNLYSAEAM